MTPGLSLCKALSLSSDTLRNFVVSAFDAVDGSSTGIANVRYWHIADIPAYADLCPLSGVKRTLGISAQLQLHMADLEQGAGPLIALQIPLARPFPLHQTLQSNLSGCPTSSVCLWSTLTPGFDSTSRPSGIHASPNIRPLALPALSVPIWHPATPGSTPSVSFHHVVCPLPFQSEG
jgi:hypothetical protein